MIMIPTNLSADKPQGAPFLIERFDFEYGKHFEYGVESLEDNAIEEDKIENWPMVYILTNKDTAYVGQTNSLTTRMDQHGANEERRDFTDVHVIFNEEFNTSVITHYEHNLIGLMYADGKYKLTNKNEGMMSSNYFSKEIYDRMFKQLWTELQRLEIAEHTIAEIEETEVFKYSPFKGLTPDQRVALDNILHAIADGLDKAQPIVVEGMPGTGKTVLAIYLLKILRDTPEYRDLNVRLLEPVTSLRNTLKQSLKNVIGLSPDDIISPTDIVKPQLGYSGAGQKGFDILLVDEAHKLKQHVNLGTQFGNYDNVNRELGLSKNATQMDWVLDQAKLPIFFYDPLQSIGPSCIDPSEIGRALGLSSSKPIKLESQMRVKAGDEYLCYIQDILNCECVEPKSFDGYDLVLHDSFEDFVSSFNATLKKHDLSRMIAGYAWKWKSRNDPSANDIEIDDIGLKWNCTYDNWVGRGIDNPEIAHEVGCIHSIQGYDLSYAYVIIGNDLALDPLTDHPQANRNSYYDRNGFATASDLELNQYIKNIYYVLLTRGILGTHIYVVDNVLREYFEKYFK